METKCNPIKIPFTFYHYFNELNSTKDTSYFADVYRAIEPLDDEEVTALELFRQKLAKYNSSKVFDYIAHALWKNVPLVYVPEDEIHVDLIEELLKDDFDLTITSDGVYFTFLNKYDQKDYDKNCSRIMNMLDRAFTTRSMLSGIFHKIIDSVLMRIGLLQFNELKFDVNSYYINPVVISNIFSEVTKFHSYVFKQTLVIDIDKASEVDDDDDICVPALFSSIENYSMLTESICSDLMLEATLRKRSKTVTITNPYICRAMFYELQQNGFDCKKSENNILVDWTNGGKKNKWSFAYRCWMRYNTITYYRICVSAITRSLRKDPENTTIVFPAPKNPIDEEFFMKYFNRHQSERCEPVGIHWGDGNPRKPTFAVRIKPENSEGVKS